jgi:plastocyanin
MRYSTGLSVSILLALAAACSNGAADKPAEPTAGRASSPTPSATASVTPTGKVIVIEMYTDEKGNYFKPAKFEVHRGDLLRFTLKAGVHNVHFLPDSNPGKSGLPPASEFLQLPDQTWEYLVSLAPGHYYFQCDPHALLGMVGRLEVEDEK